MKKLYLLKSLEWFEENSYRDSTGVFWKSKKLRDMYENDELNRADMNESEYIFELSINTDGIYIDSESPYVKSFMWGVDKIYDPETNPEYFI